MIRVVPFAPDFSDVWDQFVSSSVNGTFLHTRKFLEYHGSRFLDASLMIFEDNDLLAVFPAAFDQSDSTRVVSHPGSTFGGLVCQSKISVTVLERIYVELFQCYQGQKVQSIQIQRVPSFYERSIFEGDRYVFSKLGVNLAWASLSSTVHLDQDLKLSNRRIRGAKKSSGLEFIEGIGHLQDFWGILEENLIIKFGKKPVHSFAEISDLVTRFPQEICLHVVINKGVVVAGAMLFLNGAVVHAQYIASSHSGRELSALDGLFSNLLSDYKSRGFHYFDFGISTESRGLTINEGLYTFKSEFGSVNSVYETYLKFLY